MSAKMGEIMGKNLVKAYPLRLEEDLMEKLKVVAKNEDRNVREQITKIIREYLHSYESKHGNIVIGEINQHGDNNTINF